MATSTTTGAIYGIGIYGESRYGVVNVSIIPDGVQATCTTDSGVVIEADSIHVVIGVTATGAVGQVGTVGTAVLGVTGVEAVGYVGDNLSFSLGHTENAVGVEATGNIGDNLAFSLGHTESAVGVEATGFVGTPVLIGNAVVDLVGVSAIASVEDVDVKAGATADVTGIEAFGTAGDVTVKTYQIIVPVGVVSVGTIGTAVVVVADANVDSPSTEATTQIGTVNVTADSVYTIATGLQGQGFVGAVTVTTTQFDFESIADKYDRRRTVYVGPRSTAQERTVMVPFVPRVVYVDRRTTSSDRTKLAA